MSILSIVLLTIGGTVVALVGFAIFVLVFMTFTRIASLPALDTRMAHIEQYLRDISDAPDSTSPALYRTADGKHTAESLEELAIKVLNDPDSELGPNQKEALQSFLEIVEKETQLTSFDEDEDDDEDEDRS